MADWIPPEVEAETRGSWVPPEVEKEGRLTTFGKNIVGVGEGALNFASGMLAAPAFGLRALAEYGGQNLLGEGTDMPNALATAQSSQEALSYSPRTEAGKDSAEMFGKAYEYAREKSGGGFAKAATTLGGDEALARTFGESYFDIFGIPAGIKGYKAIKGVAAPDNAPLSSSATGKEPAMGEDVMPPAEAFEGYTFYPDGSFRLDLPDLIVKDRPEPTYSGFDSRNFREGRKEPGMGDLRSPEERVAEALVMKEKAERQRAGNVEQDQLALPFEETPTYRGGAQGGILDQSRLTVDENGIPFDRAASSRYALGDTSPGDVIGRTPEGELARSPESATRDLFGTARDVVTPIEEGRPTRSEPIEFERGLAGKTKREKKAFLKEGPKTNEFETLVTDWSPWKDLGEPKKGFYSAKWNKVIQDPLKNWPIEARKEPFGIDYYESLLEDLNLPTEKIQRNRTLKKLIREQVELRDQITKLQEKAEADAANAVRIYAKDLTRSKEANTRTAQQVEAIQKKLKTYLEKKEKVWDKVEEIYQQPLTRKIYPQGGPGGKQGGAVNPEIFTDGFEKVKDLSERGLKLIARFVPFERGSKEGYLIVEARNNKNKRVAGATFEKSREGYGLEETDLSASNVGVIPEARGNRLSKEIYQFVAEMGNDIVPSQVRTAEGRQMWEKFEQEGLASKGRISGSKELPQEIQRTQSFWDIPQILEEIYRLTPKPFNASPKMKGIPKETILKRWIQEERLRLARNATNQQKPHLFDKHGRIISDTAGQEFFQTLRRNEASPIYQKMAIDNLIELIVKIRSELPPELRGEQKLFTADPIQGAKDFIDLLRKNSKNIEDFTDKLVKELGEEMRPIAAALYGQGEKKPEAPKKQTSGEPPKRNLPKQVEQYMIGDNRPAAQFAKEEKAKGFNKWVDISPWTSIARNFSPLSIVAALNKKSPAINWLHSKITRLDNELFMKKETVKYGTKFAPDWRGFKKHVKSDDGAMTILDSLPKQRKDVVMNTFFDKFEGREIEVNEQVLMDAGMSKREAQGILAARKAFDQALKDFNEWSISVGETPITVRPNYFPHSWRGPYRVFVKNAEGETVAVYGANTWLEGQKIAKGLKAKHPEHNIETPALGKSKYNTNDITAYKDAIEFLEKDDPARKILDRTYREILSKRGARKVKLFRKGVEGFDRDVNIVGDYLDKVYNFLYNQKKRAALSDILTELEKEGVKLEKDFPNTHKYMLDATAIATHAVEDGIPAITAALDMVGMAVGQGPYGTRNFIRNMNGVATANFLTTPVFLGANAMQPIFNLPKAMQMKIRPEQAALAYGESYKKSYFPGPYEIEAMNWAVKNGHIQSRVADMLELKTGNPRTWPMKTPYWFANNVIGKVDSQITRIPSFFFYDTILKEAIPNKEARWQQAGLLTQEIMVNYSPSNSPMVFPRLGPVVGPAVRPFTQFFLSYFGQMLMYMGEMKGKPGAKATMAAMAPLITFVAAQAIMGGVNGMIGVKDSNTIIESINAMFGLNIPTMDKMLAQTDISNTILYGPVSTVTGLNLSGTVSAPSLINPPAVPGISLTADIGKNLLNFGSKAAKGELNDADKMLMALAISPRITDAAVTDYFRKEGRGEPNPYQNMEPDIGPETPGAMFGLVQPDNPLQLSDKAARYMGSRTPKQAREKLKIRELKKADLKQKEKRSEFVRLMIDRLDNDKDVDDILPKYMEQNGNMKTLKTELVQGLKERNMIFIQRFVGKSKGLNKAQKLQKLEEFRLLQDKMEDPKALMDTYRELKDAD